MDKENSKFDLHVAGLNGISRSTLAGRLNVHEKVRAILPTVGYDFRKSHNFNLKNLHLADASLKLSAWVLANEENELSFDNLKT